MILSHALRAVQKNTAITFVASEKVNLGTASTITAAYPAGTQDGDVAFMFITADSNMGSGYSATGWTRLDTNTGESDAKACLLQRVVSGTGSQTFTRSGAINGGTYIIATFRNATYSNFAGADSNGGTSVVNPPSLTGSFNATVVFGVVSVVDSTITAPTGYTTIQGEAGPIASSCGGYLLSVQTNPNPSTFSGVSASAWVAYTIGLT